MRKIEAIELDRYYHIYNRGINGENLFYSADTYTYFLQLYEKYIDPIAETFSWCLLKNHFHFLIKIKSEEEISAIFKLDSEKVNKKPSQNFSHLFNAYAQAINKRYHRHGSLFESPFRRKKVTDESCFKNLVLYIHNNPIQHGFTKHLLEYPWSSYLSIISLKKTKLQRNKVLGWFDDTANFIDSHHQKIDTISVEKWLKI